MPIKRENRKLYSPNWKQISRSIRFGRAKGKCQKCGAIHGQRSLFSKAVIVLAAAHLNQDPTDNRKKNLAALCQICHLNHDRPWNVEKIKQAWQLRRAEILRAMATTRFLKRLFRQPQLFVFDEEKKPNGH